MLTACAWRHSLAGAPLVVAGLRAFPCGSLGVGRIAVGMARQGYDLQLTRYDARAGGRRSTPRASRTRPLRRLARPGDREPWRAVQRAAWETLRRREADEAAVRAVLDVTCDALRRAGFDVDSAQTVAQAVDLLSTRQYAVIVADLLLPELPTDDWLAAIPRAGPGHAARPRPASTS